MLPFQHCLTLLIGLCDSKLQSNSHIFRSLDLSYTDKPNTAREDEFQIVDVADGKVTTKQMNTRGRLKNAKNVDEFGTTIESDAV